MSKPSEHARQSYAELRKLEQLKKLQSVSRLDSNPEGINQYSKGGGEGKITHVVNTAGKGFSSSRPHTSKEAADRDAEHMRSLSPDNKVTVEPVESAGIPYAGGFTPMADHLLSEASMATAKATAATSQYARSVGTPEAHLAAARAHEAGQKANLAAITTGPRGTLSGQVGRRGADKVNARLMTSAENHRVAAKEHRATARSMRKAK